MSDTIICQSETHGLPSEGEIMTFSYYHEKCFTFPTPYIEALARHDMAQYVEWPYGQRSERTIHTTPLEKISTSTQWGRAFCSECGEWLHPDKEEREAVAQQSLFDLEGVA